VAAGIRKLHSKGCPGREGGRCRCGAGYEAWVFSKRDGKKIRKTFALESEARRACRCTLSACQGRSEGTEADHGARGVGGLARGGQGRHDPQPLGGSLQALGHSQLRAGDEASGAPGDRERFASPDEAAKLIEAVPDADRAIWATAMYAGLRRGELQALHVKDVDLATG
jgi:hypothetical protein